VVQCVLVFPATFLLCLPLLEISGSFLLTGNPQHGWAHKEVLLFFIAGCVLGVTMMANKPELRWIAMMICVGPLCLVTIAVCLDLHHGRNPLHKLLYFRQANEGLQIALVTLPTASMTGYSLGALTSAWLRTAPGR
jgi:hypothetical protein